MFKGMKPLPKALLIAVVIGLPIGAYVKFAPKSEPKAPIVQADPVTTTTVPAESDAVKRAAELANQTPPAAAPAPAPAQADAPSTLKPSGGQDSGMDAVLKAGKK